MRPPAGEGGMARWLEAEGIVAIGDAGTIADVALVRRHLVAAATAGQPITYAALLGLLGHHFTRPRMRALCRTLDAVDAARNEGEPPLAVLVVRASDGLPGQGWWVGRSDAPLDWHGAAAHAFVGERQRAAFAYWRALAETTGDVTA